MILAPLLLTLAFAAQEAKEGPFPSRPGVTWTWGEGERRLSAEIWERTEIRKHACVRLRFWWSEKVDPWYTRDLYLVPREDRLLLAGYRIDGLDFAAEVPVPLLPKDLVVGQSWTAKFECGSMDAGEYRWQDAVFRVLARERVTVRAGVFEAWKILWADTHDEKDGFHLWISPGTGIVRIDSFSVKHDRKPWTFGLAAVDLKRPERFQRYPALEAGPRARLDVLVKLLAHEDPARREEADRELRALGSGTVPILRAGIEREQDPEVRGRLDTLVRSFVKLRLQARLLRKSSLVNEPLPVEFFLVNDGPEPVHVLPCLPDSVMSMGRKYPAISAVVTDAAGKKPSVPIAGSYWGTPRLRGDQFRRLLPGESLNLFAEGEGSAPAVLYGLREAGTYTVRLVYDIRGEEAADWDTDSGSPDEEAKRLLRIMPRGRFVTEPLLFTVTEP